MRRLLAVAAGAAALTAVARRVADFRPLPVHVPDADLDGLDADGAAARLAELVRIPTVSTPAAEHRDPPCLFRQEPAVGRRLPCGGTRCRRA